ncbi:MAG: hypothetical protein Q8N37_01080 [bacterium]|nr:hypothetical protein [bacterium]
MNDDIIDDKDEALSSKLRMQIDLQQTDEGLRRVRNEILNLNIQIRKFQQDFSRAKMALEAAETRLKVLKTEEFDLNQNAMRQKRAYIAKK